MKKYQKIGLIVIVILSGFFIIAGSIKITSMVKANEDKTTRNIKTAKNTNTEAETNTAKEATASDYNKTDIAQIFISTDSTVARDEYTKADITIEDAEGGTSDTIKDNNAAIRIRGNTTSILAKLPYNIKFSSSQSVLGMSPGKKWCLLANYADTSLMRNKLAYDMAVNLGLKYSCETRYADVWLNGSYQGNYLVTVPVETGKNRVDIDTGNHEFLLELEAQRMERGVTYFYSGISRFKLDAPETMTKEQETWLTDFTAKAEKAMKDGDYSEIKRYVDVDSFIDFFIIQELFKNVDVNYSSTRFYIKNSKIYAGPLWDFDLSSGNVSTNERYVNYMIYNNYNIYGNRSGKSYEGFWAFYGGNYVNEGNSWIGLLMRCGKFRMAIYQRYLQLQDQIVNLYQDNSVGTNQIDRLLKQYSGSFQRDNKRWPVDVYRGLVLYRNDEKTYDDSVAYLRSWLMNRNEWLLKALTVKLYEHWK